MSDLLPAVIPPYAMAASSAEDLAKLFEDAMGGLSVGFPPSIRVKQGKWRLVDRDGGATPIKPTELVEGEFLPVVILRAKKALSKVYYLDQYDPAAEAKAPDCFSDDAITPDASVTHPVSKSCATCPMNAFGSGRNAAGQPTKGKACTDSKILAVFYRGGIYQLKVNPSSLRNLAAYFGNLQERRVNPAAVMTYIGLDDTAEYTLMTFKGGQFIDEKHIPAIMDRANSQEAADIVTPRQRAPRKEEPIPEAKPAAKQTAAPVELFPEQPAAEAKPATKRGPKPAPAPVVVAEPEEEAPFEVGGEDDIANLLKL